MRSTAPVTVTIHLDTGPLDLNPALRLTKKHFVQLYLRSQPDNMAYVNQVFTAWKNVKKALHQDISIGSYSDFNIEMVRMSRSTPPMIERLDITEPGDNPNLNYGRAYYRLI